MSKLVQRILVVFAEGRFKIQNLLNQDLWTSFGLGLDMCMSKVQYCKIPGKVTDQLLESRSNRGFGLWT